MQINYVKTIKVNSLGLERHFLKDGILTTKIPFLFSETKQRTALQTRHYRPLHNPQRMVALLSHLKLEGRQIIRRSSVLGFAFGRY